MHAELWRTHTHRDVDPVGFCVLSDSCCAEDILGQECCLRVTQGWWCDWLKVVVVATRTDIYCVWNRGVNIDYCLTQSPQHQIWCGSAKDIAQYWTSRPSRHFMLTHFDCVSIYFFPVLTITHSLSDNFIRPQNKTDATMAWTMTVCL